MQKGKRKGRKQYPLVLQQSKHKPAFLCRYNHEAFGNVLPPELPISWSKHLKTTAGVTHYQRAPAQGALQGPAWEYTARIELSVKVLDSECKLQRTLVHEMCHAAAWLVDHVAKPPHGPVCGGASVNSVVMSNCVLCAGVSQVGCSSDGPVPRPGSYHVSQL